jgi:hypothetical protein
MEWVASFNQIFFWKIQQALKNLNIWNIFMTN